MHWEHHAGGGTQLVIVTIYGHIGYNQTWEYHAGGPVPALSKPFSADKLSPRERRPHAVSASSANVVTREPFAGIGRYP